MALRSQWVFSYKRGAVGAGAKLKETHHKERLAFWVKTQRKLMDEIKETGLEIIESQAASYSITDVAHGPQIVIRTEFQTKLNECHSKIKEHCSFIEIYISFHQALLLHPDQSIDLDVADIDFFFGKSGQSQVND